MATKVVRITDSMTNDALEMLRECFFPHENICNAVRLLEDSPDVDTGSRFKCTEASVELEGLTIGSLKDGVSIAVVDEQTNEWLGISINKIITQPLPGEKTYFDKYYEDHVKSPPTKALLEFLTSTDSDVDLFKHFQANCGMELLFLGVSPKARGRGLAPYIVEQCIEVARNYEGSPKPKFVSAVYTSRFSQKAGVKAGMPILSETPYDKFSYNGRSFSDAIGPVHTSYTISAVAL